MTTAQLQAPSPLIPTKLFDQPIAGNAEAAVDIIGNILDSCTEYSIIGNDLDGMILVWNEGARRLYGYEADELVGQANSEILHTAEDVAAGTPQQMRDTALREGHWEGTVTRRRKNGSRFLARVVVTPRRDGTGSPVGFLLMSKNISDAGAAEHVHERGLLDSAIVGAVDLDRAASQLSLQQTALDTAADAILVTDAEGVILWVNPAFTTTTGYTADEAIGRTPRILKSGRHDAAFYRGFWGTIRAGRTWRGEFVNRRKDGTVYYDEHTVTPVIGDDGVVTHFVGIMHDVTARKLGEEQLLEAHAHLRALLDHSPAVLYALKPDAADESTFIPYRSSANITRLLGFEVDETLTREWWFGQVHPDDIAVVEASILETLTHGQSRTEYRLRHKDGTYRWVDDHRRLVHDASGGPAELVGVWTDVTDRRDAQEQLQESERRLREMYNNLDLVSVMLDREGRLTYCNDYLLRLTGWSSEEIIGRDWVDTFIPRDEAAAGRESVASFIAGNPTNRHRTNRIVTRSGATLLIHWNNSVLRSTSGNVIGVTSIGEDITSRAVAESELRRSEEHLRAIIHASADAITEWNVATGEVIWSDRAYSMLGHTRGTFQPSLESCLALVHPDDLAVFRAACEEHIAHGEPCQARVRVLHADGFYIPVLTRGQLQRETGRMFGTFTDLSIVERAEEQIREQAALIDQTHDAIAVRDLESRITFWSKGAERLYGWSAGDAVGRPFHELLHVDAEIQGNALKATLAGEEWRGEIGKTTSAGREVVVESRWTLVRDDLGRPKSIISIDTDITVRKNLEQQFYRAQRLESLGTVAGGIAHDLNNLLMPILMGVTLLKRLQPDARGLRAIGFIESSAKRGTELVKQVAMFARGVEGVPKPIELAGIVREIVEIVGSTFPKNVTVETSMPESLSPVVADATQLNQVLLNLCVNARDAMPGGGQITISASEADLDRQYAVMGGGTTAGRYDVLQVADTGSGMPKYVLERIFEPFFTTKVIGKGTGLGLSVAHGIVRAHGGFIEVSSELGRGTTFRIYLPAHSGPAAAATIEEEAVSLPRGNGETILVVDDEAAIRIITKETLEAFGYAVITAVDGAHAIGLYAHNRAKIAAVLTDIMMPVMDGTALIAALQHINPAVQIIAMSGNTEPGKVMAMTTAGRIHFLPKPYGAEVILKTLSEVLRDPRTAPV